MKASQRTLVFVLAGACALGLSGWVAWAQIGATGTVLGCVGNSGIIRGVDETTGNCRSGDTALTWYTKAGADAAFAPAAHTHPRADGPCFDDTNRYVDCGNGTVTDTLTGLIWLKRADCVPVSNYVTANQAAAALKNGDCGGTLTDGSSAGDWRLPTKAEWEATVARAVVMNCVGGSSPSVTNDAGTGCYGTGSGSSFVGVASAIYWSSTSHETFPSLAWDASLVSGAVATFGSFGKISAFRVWPVRGGSR